MLFGVKLNNGVYPPWKKYYLNYDTLKKLLRESIVSDGKVEWTEEDESRFVQELDKELEKVYSFESDKFGALSDKITGIEKQIEGTNANSVKPKDLEPQVEEIMEEASQLDQFRRLNYTGFTKIVKKHDRLHPKYQVRPLLHVRLQALPFHSEDYSPLLYRLSRVYKFLGENFGSAAGSAKSQQLGSVSENHPTGYVTRQYWIHPENLMEVKTKILRRLPVLVYNREGDDEEEMGADPTVTSLYLDNSEFSLYQSQLSKGKADDDVPTSLRFRWYGHLYEKPDIVLEQHNEDDGRTTRITLKEKTINDFLAGNKSVIEKRVAKLKQKNTSARAIDDFESAGNELQSFITSHHIEPMLRTIYKRAAFEIPGDDRVRVILDSDILFIREDSLNKEHPIRDPSSWHRGYLDQPNVNLKDFLRRGEFASFPYSVLELRLKHREDTQKIEKISWVEELVSSNLIKEVPHFSKFLQGIATLYAEDDRLDSLPFWLNDLDTDIRSSAPPADSVHGRSSQGHIRPRATYNFGDEDDEESDDSEVGVAEREEDMGDRGSGVGFPTWTNGPKLNDIDSEDEEVLLPQGVVKPASWIKNQSAVKVEAKVWLANERTFNKTLHITVLLSALTFTLYNSVEASTNPVVATFVAYLLFALTLFTGIWGYRMYIKRLESIRSREEAHLDDPTGPIVIASGLLLALIFNFAAQFHARRHKEPHVPPELVF